jgi:hypothetical protein
MEVRYQCNLADYKEALSSPRPTPLKRKIFRVVLIWVVIILGVFVMEGLGFRQGPAGVGVIIFCFLFWLVYRIVLFPLWVSKDFRGHPNFQRAQSVRIDEDGLHKTSEIEQGETMWLAYTDWRETQNLFVLYLGSRLLEVIPKRALSREQLQEFRRLLHEKIPQTANTSSHRSASVRSTLA